MKKRVMITTEADPMPLYIDDLQVLPFNRFFAKVGKIAKEFKGEWIGQGTWINGENHIHDIEFDLEDIVIAPFIEAVTKEFPQCKIITPEKDKCRSMSINAHGGGGTDA